MKLTIKFSGLFLFSRQKDQLVVLGPRTGLDLPIPVEPHVARLQVIQDAGNGGESHHHEGPALRPLEGLSVEIGDGGPSSAKTGTLSSRLADLNDITGKRPRPELYGPTPGDRLTTRIVVKSGEQCGSVEGAKFRVRRSARHLTTELYWQMELPRDSVTLTMKALDGSGEDSLTLSSSGDLLCLGIFYVPEHHLPGHGHVPGRPPRGTISPHFIALYSLYDDPEDIAIPIFDGDFAPGGPPSTCDWCRTIGPRGGDPVTCVGGTGDE